MNDEKKADPNMGEYVPDDAKETVDAGSETSGETAVDTTATEQSETVATTTDTQASDIGAGADAGGAADVVESSETSTEVDPNASRTDFADTGLKAGDACKCPDGRKGTVHRFDAGLICIPNEG